MAVMDVSRQRRSLLDDATVLNHLPVELLEIIKDHASPKILDAVSEAALSPRLTELIFTHFEPTFPDICARWILNLGDLKRILDIASALARILPFAPYLASFLAHSPHGTPALRHPPPVQLSLPNSETVLQLVDEAALLRYLVTLWRLISFDSRIFSRSISPAFIQKLFSHDSRPVRYVAVRIFCQLLRASDVKLEALIDRYVGRADPIVAELDGIQVDYGFLTLHEQARVKKVLSLREKVQNSATQAETEPLAQNLTSYVAAYGDVLLPCPSGLTGDPASLVLTSTTTKNLECLARMLHNDDPVLLHGLPGSGKTSLVHEIARDLGMYSSMVTLHLNEQTDAKMLVGLYSTDSKPGSFQWRPGVLTTAVKEGRWVLVEDLDRAPTEVLSTLLPLIERKELLIPSRGETIRAAKSFRLFATVRTTRGMNGRENLPTIVGMRFWQSMHAEPLTEPELEEVILQTFPVLRKFVPGILAVYNRLTRFGQHPTQVAGGRSLVDRRLNLRDLLKWCQRLRECLSTAGSVSGDEPISESTRDWMFMEALDCFVGSCPDVELGKKLATAIAEEMHMSAERADHYITTHTPTLEENEANFSIGRVRLRKQKFSDRVQKSKRPFASTSHAKKLLEQIAIAVKLSEPVLLVGETGIGKTTVVQQLADSLGHKLIAVNLSQQSEVGDLLGGFKPVNVRTLAVPLKEDFEDLFTATGISTSKNQKYIEQVGKCFAKGQWSKVSKLWREAPKMFAKIVSELEKTHSVQEEVRSGDAQPTKRRKTQSKLQNLLDLRPRWDAFAKKLEQFDIQISSGGSTFAFSFMEGNLVKAVRNGDWVLLDEINLASPDTLESIADLLTGPAERPSILLSETGEIEKVVAHPNFRIFGAMNPATDVGKRDLPAGIRSRFTELYVRSPDGDLKDLLTIIKTYLGSTSNKHDKAADDVARLYLNTKQLADERRLVDGANEVPHFSLRTLTRVLSYVNTIAPSYGLRRALYEGFSMGFLTLLNRDSEAMLLPLIFHHLFEAQGNAQSLLSQAPKHPNDGKQYVRFKNKAGDRQYWLFQGNEPVLQRDDYIITTSVERNLLNLVRATSTRRFPILIQGPTSAGKTSMIEYLSNFTGNKFVRINNHEHTDLQEYLGTYVSGADGKLRFQEGLLVQAMRQGHWIVLDELNLAPTDVLEALNRLLDDNRELLIPETQEVVRPHENFILFATQNPPGLYGGRKVLSRAFRNRFLELHFDDIPEDELEYILQQRSRNTSPPDCRRIVNVYKELSRLRQTSRVFEKKDSFATLRDLFRWALREADSREEIAAHGFMLLAERVRNEEERVAVKEVIEQVFKVKLDPQELYSSAVAPELKSVSQKSNQQGVVWTHAMRRLYVLVSRALRNNEPVLLVGETGCGKTTVCQLLAEALGKQLHIVNAHQNTETGDLIGSQRPVRNRGAILESLGVDLSSALKIIHQDASGTIEERLDRYKSLDASQMDAIPVSLRAQIASCEARSRALFEWSDGALVEAMRDGQFFLLDEISLADDSVLERLNSVLEPQRTLLLAEKGTDNSFVAAVAGFQMFATMNPGGDFGKKELSPALRNRFTEIWVPGLSESEDIRTIVHSKLVKECKGMVDVIVQFASWFGNTFRSMSSTPFSIRELLAWVQFINNFHTRGQLAALVHGASTIFIDSIGANPSAILAVDAESISQRRVRCLEKLCQLSGQDVTSFYDTHPELLLTDDTVSIGDFSIRRSPTGATDPGFAFHAPTTRLNGMRVLRALQMQKPVLLEGSPGVGKTTLVAALALLCGQPLTRINLSDQTDLMDLFGTDVPVEGAEAGNFAWRDAPFLQAMQRGEWVLLDEMNLASQSVLEGLNACLDHRGEVYISELDQVFKRHPNFRLFAAQNPHHQGGGRKGLPSSFVNRFVVVYADVFADDDLERIASHNFPQVPSEEITQLIRFISRMDHELVKEKTFGAQGGPWEFNLRDVLRWLRLLSSSDGLLRDTRIDDFLDIIVKQRFRTQRDRDEVDRLFADVTGVSPRPHSLYHNITPTMGQVGLALLERNVDRQPERIPTINVTPRLAELETMMICVKKNIPCILSSPSGYGKSSLLQHVAALAGKSLVVFPMNADIDTMDLVGGFEQADPLREVNATLMNLRDSLQMSVISLTPDTVPSEALQLLHMLQEISTSTDGIAAIRPAVESLARSIPTDSEVGQLLSSTRELLDRPLSLANPRFEWLDGIIIKALQAGQWLVLDNANMCNASVLDRLNSLLEPNGSLSINENCEPGGEPRIVKPHPDFRIFLTVDPRYGELSRAMRNRAVEIFIHDAPPVVSPCFSRVAEVESSLQRLSMLQDLLGAQTDDSSLSGLTEIGMDNITLQDLSVLKRFASEGSSVHLVSQTLLHSTAQLLNFVETSWGAQSLSSVSNLYKSIIGPSVAMMGDNPIHPLSNFPLTRLAQGKHQTYWLAMRFEMSRDFSKIISRLEDHRSQAQMTKLGSLSRLQRSLVSDRVAAVSKDSTVKLGAFLASMSIMVLDYLGADTLSADSWQLVSKLLRMILRYLEQTLVLSSGSEFDEAKFFAHLVFGNKLLKSYLGADSVSENREQALVSSVLTKINRDFEVGFKLSTGLSMEMLWTRFRPTPVHDEATFVNCLELEKLGLRFDDLRWRSYTPIADLCKAAETLEKAYSVIKTSKIPTTELVQNLSTEIHSLEAQIGIDAKEIIPYFKDEFEKLRQIVLFRGADMRAMEGSPKRELVLLSNLPTQLRMQFEDSKERGTILDRINVLVCQDQYVWDGKLASSLWSKIQNSGTVSLGSLALLDVELPILARHVADLTAEIGADPILRLNEMLWQMVQEVFSVHQPDLVDVVTGVLKSIQQAVHLSEQVTLPELLKLEQIRGLLDSIEASHFRQTVVQHFIPAMAALALAKLDNHRRAHLSAVAWNHLSVGTLLLYVPDRVFDPQIRPQLEREFLRDLHADLESKILNLQSFEKWHTGQTVNARIDVLQDEIAQIDPVPEEIQLVFRPEKSELNRLHAEFANVLRAVNAVAIPSLNQLSSTDDGLSLVRENVQRLISRLSSRFEAYQDMTIPTVHLLRCLLIGLSLCDATTSNGLSSQTTQLTSATPFMGGSLQKASLSSLPRDTFEFLDLASIAVTVQGLDKLDSNATQAVFECFHHFYDDWNKKLEIDRKAEQANTSLYRFRGSLEDEEEVDAEEFNELFPTFEDEEGSAAPRPAKVKDQVRDTSIRVAQAHKTIFLSPKESSAAFSQLCMSMGSRITKEVQDAEYIDRSLTERLLPSTMLLLGDKSTSLAASSTDKSYNFYLDENLAEARTLVSLANKIKSRFKELQSIDEIGHMQPLADVVTSCDRLLELIHQEPLAKILPSVEKLHANVYEWQFGGWASRAHAVLELHNSLTDTVIRWRRLELSTWANLFDMERSKCEDDAYSWWFIAYQVVVAVPLTMVDNPEEMRRYSVSLLETLETYFSTSILGQFSTRLALLGQLRNHLKYLTRDYPVLDVIYHSLTNFLSYYVRYRKLVEEAIQRGRVPLDKKMKDVLLLASWKDTNINALRESARKSHQKLFRLVRKFRAVLGQDMKTILAQGLPDEEVSPVTVESSPLTAEEYPESTALSELVKSALPAWLDAHRRVANADKTASVIFKIAQSSTMVSDIPSTIVEFISSLDTAMEELRKETPAFLNDENKEQVKHLKTRKRKLFADTLRDLRQMGIRYNLSQDRLTEQESLAIVLSSFSSAEDQGTVDSASGYFLHKVLDLAPQVRASAREHSEDLTAAEMTRSIGFVEGMIHMLLGQRRGILAANDSWSSLQRRIDQLRSTSSSETGHLVRAETDNYTPEVLPWLVHVVNFAIHLVEIHGKLGETDYGNVIEQLQSWVTRFAEHQSSLQSLGVGLRQVTTVAKVDRWTAAQADIQLFVDTLDKMILEWPNLGFALREIKLWSQTGGTTTEPTNGLTTALPEFANSVSTLCDRALVAIEHAKKAAAEVPRDQEDAGWVTKHDEAFFAIIKKLHMNGVAANIDRCLELLEQVDLADTRTSQACKALLGLATPILHQYASLCRHVVNQVQYIHRASAQMAYHLTRAFTKISSQGFCTPKEKSDETSGESGQVESGTGLGDGEGAEDISKDIKDDEDLSELAQEANKEKSGEIEDEKDAVDMADEELEGDMGSVDGADDDEEDGSKKGDDDEEEQDLDEETGEVDDLDPTAVDEKMWDGKDEEEAEKDQQGDKPKGQQKDDEQMATEDDTQAAEEQKGDDDKKGDEPDQPDPEDAEAEKEDVQAQEELNKQEQTAQDNDTLALPEEMDLDFDDNESASSDSDDLDLDSDSEDKMAPEEENEAGKEEEDEQPADNETGQAKEPDEMEDENAEVEEEPAEEEGQAVGEDEVQDEVKPEEDEKAAEEQAEEQSVPQQPDDAAADKDNAAPSDVKSGGQDQTGDAMELDDEFQDKAAQQDEGEMGQGAADKEAAAGNKGSMSNQADPVDNNEQEKDSDEPSSSAPFRKLGDALEKWHRQQSDIKDAEPEDDQAKQEHKPDEDLSKREFQHLQNDDAAADTQAMGGAKEEEVQPIDEAMAIDEEAQDPNSRVMEEEDKDEPNDEMADDADPADAAETQDKNTQDHKDQDEGRTGVKTRQGKFNKEEDDADEDDVQMSEQDEDETIEEASTQLSTTHISPEQRELRDFGECMQQWGDFQNKTHALSLSLTSQLRLILTPSQSTKLSGSFRTGKRLNIKRIIPYIASSYKRDKIWMRRAIPTKRTYQILLCVDDSKSMGESSSGNLAMESLVMVSRSLAMLEAGQVGVVGFGGQVFTAHSLTEPFAADAGGKILQNFTFSQDRTDVALLIRQTIDTFREARQQNSGGSGAGDLWQLSLILSDGLTPSSAHDSIRRLLREAMEERIMIVFIIMDDTEQKKGDSVLELKEAKFVSEGGESRVVIERYLDTFPFQYYLIVHHLEELPNALAGLLRTWFAEVSA